MMKTILFSIVATFSLALTSFGAAPNAAPAKPNLVLFLASDESLYVNGEILGVTGGQLLA